MGGILVVDDGAFAVMTHTTSFDMLAYCARPAVAPWGAGDLWDEGLQAKALYPKALAILMLPEEVMVEAEKGSFGTEHFRRMRKLAGIELGAGPSTASINAMASLWSAMQDPGQPRATKGWVG